MASDFYLPSMVTRSHGGALALVSAFLACCGWAAAQEVEEPVRRPVAAEQPADVDVAANDEAGEPADGAVALGDGRLIRIRLPIAGNADEHFKSAIQRALSQLNAVPRRDGRR